MKNPALTAPALPPRFNRPFARRQWRQSYGSGSFKRRVKRGRDKPGSWQAFNAGLHMPMP